MSDQRKQNQNANQDAQDRDRQNPQRKDRDAADDQKKMPGDRQTRGQDTDRPGQTR